MGGGAILKEKTKENTVMKFCMHCGAEINEDAIVCVKCGRAVESKPKNSNNNNGLLTAAKVFMIIGCVAYPTIGLIYGLLLLTVTIATAPMIIGAIVFIICFCIPLSWTIPLTVTVNKKIRNREPIGVGIKICTLLFVNMVAGILLLCHNEE